MSNEQIRAEELSGGKRAATPTGRAANIPGGMPAVIGAALVLLVGAGAFFMLGSDEADGKSASCFTDTLHLTTATALRPAVDQAVKAVQKEDPCVDIQVQDGAVKDVINMLADPNAKLPDLWIPDSPSWQGQLEYAGYKGTIISPSIAETPVALATGPSGNAPASWYATLATGQLSMRDPSADGASALALLAPYAEMKQTGIARGAIDAARRCFVKPRKD